MELATGLHTMPQTITRDDGSENTIHPAAVETEKGVVLIDVGYAGLVEQIGTNLADIDADWADVCGVLLTHQDGDHAGALAEVVERSGATVYAQPRAAPYIDGREHPIKSPEGERYPPADVDVEIVGGVSFRTDAGPMDVCFTPGHAPGHCSLHLPDAGVLVAADACTVADGAIGGPSEEFTLDMPEALDSLASLADRDFDRVLCHHGGVVDADGDDVRALVDGLRE